MTSWGDMQGKTWGDLVPTLPDDTEPPDAYTQEVTQVINEMKADIETLKARVSELEAKPNVSVYKCECKAVP